MNIHRTSCEKTKLYTGVKSNDVQNLVSVFLFVLLIISQQHFLLLRQSTSTDGVIIFFV